MKLQIQNYIESKVNAWSETTLRSEFNRLKAVTPYLHLPADEFYNALKSQYSPYSLKTLMLRASKFKEFYGDYTYKAFMQTNARLFKYVYISKPVNSTFEAARTKIALIQDPEVRKIASLMLSTGMRIHEALKYDGSGQVIGKGGKPRRIYSRETASSQLTYLQVYRAMKLVGLKPHDLRKLAASKLAASGLAEADLMEVMGWSSIQTASRYLQPMLEDKLKHKVMEALNG